MVDYHEIYRQQGAEYDRLVSREDYQGNILRALQNIRPLAGLEVIELGAGTGRLTRFLSPFVRHIVAMDSSAHMLATARRRLAETGSRNWRIAVADNRRLPIVDGAGDLAIAGWSLGHMVAWYPDRWREEIGRTLGEMKRALRPGGTVVILETLGTGRETPQPPTDELADYYALLEQEHGLARSWIRTDYRFRSLEEGRRLTQFFFGRQMAERVVRENLLILPECTGIWHTTTAGGRYLPPNP